MAAALVLAADRFADYINAGSEPSFVVVVTELRLDVIFSDVERGDVRQRAFQSVADLDVHFAVAFKNEQDHAVALLFLSDAPRLRDPLSVIFDRTL